MSQGLRNERNEDGKDTRAIAEGLVETWKQIVEPRMVFFHYRRKLTDLNEKKMKSCKV